MSEDRPQMDAPTMLRLVRHMLAQVNRKFLQSQIREDGTTHGIPLASYAARRDVRQFERRILRSRALHRVAVAYASRITGSTEFDLYSLAGLLRYLSYPLRGTTLRALAEESKKLREDVETTVRVLRKFAELGAVNTKREWVLEVAEDIESFYIFSNPSHASYLPYDQLVGQKGDRRAFVTRAIASNVPDDTESRFTTIAELVELTGHDTSPQLVRSTLLKGAT